MAATGTVNTAQVHITVACSATWCVGITLQQTSHKTNQSNSTKDVHIHTWLAPWWWWPAYTTSTHTRHNFVCYMWRWSMLAAHGREGPTVNHGVRSNTTVGLDTSAGSKGQIHSLLQNAVAVNTRQDVILNIDSQCFQSSPGKTGRAQLATDAPTHSKPLPLPNGNATAAQIQHSSCTQIL